MIARLETFPCNGPRSGLRLVRPIQRGCVDDERRCIVEEALALDDRVACRGSRKCSSSGTAASSSVGETIAPTTNALPHDEHRDLPGILAHDVGGHRNGFPVQERQEKD